MCEVRVAQSMVEEFTTSIPDGTNIGNVEVSTFWSSVQSRRYGAPIAEIKGRSYSTYEVIQSIASKSCCIGKRQVSFGRRLHLYVGRAGWVVCRSEYNGGRHLNCIASTKDAMEPSVSQGADASGW
jgi:hypothetical protein